MPRLMFLSSKLIEEVSDKPHQTLRKKVGFQDYTEVSSSMGLVISSQGVTYALDLFVLPSIREAENSI